MEALKKIPIYAKYMKEFLSKKNGLRREELVLLTTNCSAIIHNKVPQKKTDLRSFTIPFSIGKLHIGKALYDLGANINRIPLSLMKKLGIVVVKPARTTLSLADRSIKHPYEIV